MQFKIGTHKIERILDYVHTNVWRLVQTTSLRDSVYFMCFIDDHSRKVWVYFMRHKSVTFDKFKLWKTKMENQIGRNNKCLLSENGIEYIDSRFIELCKEYEIKRHFIVRKTPQYNGVVERMNRSIVGKARCIRLKVGLEKKFWAKTVSMACYLINRSPRAALDGKVAEEVWTGNEVNYSGLKVFRCLTYTHIAGDER